MSFVYSNKTVDHDACAICKKPFHGQRNQLYCSYDCKQKAATDRQRQRWHRIKAKKIKLQEVSIKNPIDPPICSYMEWDECDV